jgi:hypothetical protein
VSAAAAVHLGYHNAETLRHRASRAAVQNQAGAAPCRVRPDDSCREKTRTPELEALSRWPHPRPTNKAVKSGAAFAAKSPE